MSKMTKVSNRKLVLFLLLFVVSVVQGRGKNKAKANRDGVRQTNEDRTLTNDLAARRTTQTATPQEILDAQIGELQTRFDKFFQVTRDFHFYERWNSGEWQDGYKPSMREEQAVREIEGLRDKLSELRRQRKQLDGASAAATRDVGSPGGPGGLPKRT